MMRRSPQFSSSDLKRQKNRLDRLDTNEDGSTDFKLATDKSAETLGPKVSSSGNITVSYQKSNGHAFGLSTTDSTSVHVSDVSECSEDLLGGIASTPDNSNDLFGSVASVQESTLSSDNSYDFFGPITPGTVQEHSSDSDDLHDYSHQQTTSGRIKENTAESEAVNELAGMIRSTFSKGGASSRFAKPSSYDPANVPTTEYEYGQKNSQPIDTTLGHDDPSPFADLTVAEFKNPAVLLDHVVARITDYVATDFEDLMKENFPPQKNPFGRASKSAAARPGQSPGANQSATEFCTEPTSYGARFQSFRTPAPNAGLSQTQQHSNTNTRATQSGRTSSEWPPVGLSTRDNANTPRPGVPGPQGTKYKGNHRAGRLVRERRERAIARAREAEATGAVLGAVNSIGEVTRTLAEVLQASRARDNQDPTDNRHVRN